MEIELIRLRDKAIEIKKQYGSIHKAPHNTDLHILIFAALSAGLNPCEIGDLLREVENKQP